MTRKRDQYAASIDTRPEYLVHHPVGSWWFSYDWTRQPMEHRLGRLTPDVDFLRDTHRYALCGFGPISTDAMAGCPCVCAPGYEQRHCRSCARIIVTMDDVVDRVLTKESA